MDIVVSDPAGILVVTQRSVSVHIHWLSKIDGQMRVWISWIGLPSTSTVGSGAGRRIRWGGRRGVEGIVRNSTCNAK